jgi:hypothetical protein
MTVVYYTGNGDYPRLEQAVRDTIARNCQGLPIVSVSHKPLDFGINICVGPIEQSPEHVYMQLRLGAMAARTRFVAVCEADTLYPPEFFRLSPRRTNTYYYPSTGYITWKNYSDVFNGKVMHELTGIVARDHLLRIVSALQEKWAAILKLQAAGHESRINIPHIVKRMGSSVHADLGPVVTLKTDLGMHWVSPHIHRQRLLEIPPWGSIQDVWNTYRCE